MKVNRCLATYSPHGSTTNQPTKQLGTKWAGLYCPGTLFTLVFFLLGHETKWVKNANIWPKMPILGQIWSFLGQKSIFGGEGVKLLVPSYQGTNEAPFSCWKHWPVRLQLVSRDKNVQFWPENLHIWDQKSIFCVGIAIFVNRAYHQYTPGPQLSHSDHHE